MLICLALCMVPTTSGKQEKNEKCPGNIKELGIDEKNPCNYFSKTVELISLKLGRNVP